MAGQDVTPQTLAILVEAAQLPWASAGALATRAGHAVADVATACNALIESGCIQYIAVGLSAYPKRLYAPTEAGLCAAASALRLSPDTFARRAHLTEPRFWALRAGWEVAQEMNAIGMRTQQKMAHAQIAWETFVERRSKRRALFLHGRLAVTTDEGVLPFYVLTERDGSSPWHWYRTLKYLQAWAGRGVGAFPPVLVVARRALSVQIILSVNHMAGGVPTFATFDRHATLSGGISACEWHMMRPDRHIVTADPLQLPPISVAEYAASVHRVRRIEIPIPARHGRINASARRAQWTGFSVSQLPSALSRLPEMDALDDARYGALKFLAAHPVCPATTLAEFTGMSVNEAVSAVQYFEALGFAEQVETHPREARWFLCADAPDQALAKFSPEALRMFVAVRKHPNMRAAEVARTTVLPVARVQAGLEQLQAGGLILSIDQMPEHRLWAVTDDAVALVAARAMQPVEQAMRRHRFFRADHARRTQHTRETHAFFEMLHNHCARRSRASASFEAKATGADDGAIPFYELIDFESEMTAAAWYIFRGHGRFWRPDGFGLLRAGREVTPFWLEMDGTTSARSRRDAALWEDKLGRMCDYLASDHWRLKHDAFPRLLIVSSAVRQRAVVAEALVGAARSRSAAPPLTLITGHEALAQRGPLGPIWFRLAPRSYEPTYAFEGIAPQVLQTAPRPRNLLDDLKHAERLGLLDLVAPMTK